MTRVATGHEYAGRSPDTLIAQHHETPSEHFDRDTADGGAESDFAEGISSPLPIAGSGVIDFSQCLPGKRIPIFQDRVDTDTTVLIIRVVFTL